MTFALILDVDQFNTFFQILQKMNQIREQISENISQIDRLLGSISSFKQTIRAFNKLSLEKIDNENFLIWAYDPQLDFLFTPYNEKPLKIMPCEIPFLQIQTKYNWIESYLDRNDTEVKGKVESQVVTLVKEQQEKFYYKNQENRENVVETRQFYEENKFVEVQFIHHKNKYEFKNNIIKVENQEDQLLLLVSIHHSSDQVMRRILIFKFDETLSRYFIYDGTYSQQNNLKSFTLSRGSYIFMPTSDTNFDIFLPEEIAISITERQKIKELNLMIGGFRDCQYNKLQAEFMRSSDFNCGIVVEIYRNFYKNQLIFSDKQTRLQDKKLMFADIYTNRLRNHHLKAFQTVIEFYEITKMPAVLYIPQKIVIKQNGEVEESRTIHSILK